jgi:hypothetical protein
MGRLVLSGVVCALLAAAVAVLALAVDELLRSGSGREG